MGEKVSTFFSGLFDTFMVVNRFSMRFNIIFSEMFLYLLTTIIFSRNNSAEYAVWTGAA